MRMRSNSRLWSSPALLMCWTLLLLLLLLASRRFSVLAVQSIRTIEVRVGLGKSCPYGSLSVFALFLALHRRLSGNITGCRAFAGLRDAVRGTYRLHGLLKERSRACILPHVLWRLCARARWHRRSRLLDTVLTCHGLTVIVR